MEISKDMTIGYIVKTYPRSVYVLYAFGLGCVGCPSAQVETIEQASEVHGLNLNMLLEALNAEI